MIRQWHHFHKWEYVKNSYTSEFLGEKCEKYYDDYSFCSKCGNAQSHVLIGMLEYGWMDLTECETNILKSKIEPVQEKDKIVWYFK
jgi:hypothetical protein